jgi:hypothetical protein
MNARDDLLWKTRAFIYAQFMETTHPPSADGTARHFDIPVDEAAVLYRELHERHALLLEPGTLQVRMAFPFSGVPTDFKVQTNGKTYMANCAWDMLGIPAALHSREAVIEAMCAESREPIHLELREGKVVHSEVMIHFEVPFSRWYDDLPYT